MTESILDRVTEHGAAADLAEQASPSPPDAVAAVAALRAAAEALDNGDEPLAIALFTAAGRLHDPAALDQILTEISGRRIFAFLKASPRRRLLRVARAALRQVTEVGAAQLAAAIIGELGGAQDAGSLESLGAHPLMTLHAATALSNLDSWEGRLSLLRLLHATTGDARVAVIDRLLPHTRQPAVRLALLRDALPGLDAVAAREVAADIAASCNAQMVADDQKSPDDLRRAARDVLRVASQ